MLCKVRTSISLFVSSVLPVGLNCVPLRLDSSECITSTDPRYSFSGRVVDEHGDPVPGARVSIALVTATGERMLPCRQCIVDTDAQGQFGTGFVYGLIGDFFECRTEEEVLAILGDALAPPLAEVIVVVRKEDAFQIASYSDVESMLPVFIPWRANDIDLGTIIWDAAD